MDAKQLDQILADTLEDKRLSRGERTALRKVFAEYTLDSQQRAFVRHRAFALAKASLTGHDNQRVLEWVEGVVKTTFDTTAGGGTAEVFFSPGEDCLDAIMDALDEAKQSADICVFTITDNRIAHRILDLHARGVSVRIISDNDKSEDRGSDINRLADRGVPVRVDYSPHHMHHKFAVFDRSKVLTGSYNWTRSAAEHNRENVLLSDDARLVAPYQRAFDELWAKLGANAAP